MTSQTVGTKKTDKSPRRPKETTQASAAEVDTGATKQGLNSSDNPEAPKSEEVTSGRCR